MSRSARCCDANTFEFGEHIYEKRPHFVRQQIFMPHPSSFNPSSCYRVSRCLPRADMTLYAIFDEPAFPTIFQRYLH